MRKTCRRCLGMLSVSPTQAGIRVRSLGLLCRATAQISASDRFCKFTVRPVANLYQRSVRSTTRSGAQGDPDTSAVTASVHQSSKTWKVLNGINDSVKWVVTLTAACVLVSFRNIYVQWCLVGSVATAFSCKVLGKVPKSFAKVEAKINMLLTVVFALLSGAEKANQQTAASKC